MKGKKAHKEGAITAPDFNSKYFSKHYIEVVKEKPLLDRERSPMEIIKEVYDSNTEQIKKQSELLNRTFKNGNAAGEKAFDSNKADVLLRDDFLDTYFKNTYVEWGMRQFQEKAKAIADYIANQEQSTGSLDNLISNLHKTYVNHEQKEQEEQNPETEQKVNPLKKN
ncbi:UNKNOWN [Stylonychia lemnae]|uniref:Uncharacterized protein n=1 Tax=Stylonychia lemnae TaxID=5949 RepID=A0A078ALZ3_STYLE|nr:UNKNOWN [Stylonychia lemnae]|eukprot:CDW83380.1 UNKNOWN [Stylonychia lemnae]